MLVAFACALGPFAPAYFGVAVGFFNAGGSGTRIENFLVLVMNFENGDPINWIHFRMN